MNCLITAGPTYECLDRVRRLTNFSTGNLGSTLADFLASHGHSVHLLLGEMATHPGPSAPVSVERFSTTSDLLSRFVAQSKHRVDAIFHAAAVSDFTFGKTWARLPSGELIEAASGKLSTRDGVLLAELVPTPKVISQLRSLFASAKLVGWKYEVDGSREEVLKHAMKQLQENQTTACVANGPAYGDGFGWVTPNGAHEPVKDASALFQRILRFLSES